MIGLLFIARALGGECDVTDATPNYKGVYNIYICHEDFRGATIRAIDFWQKIAKDKTIVFHSKVANCSVVEKEMSLFSIITTLLMKQEKKQMVTLLL